MALGERLKLVFGLLTEIEQFDAGIHVAREILSPREGEEREVEVLYVGLGAGFAVEPSGGLGGTGYPTSTGWQWEWRPEWADPVREAIRIYRKERSASFVQLPLTVREEAP